MFKNYCYKQIELNKSKKLINEYKKNKNKLYKQLKNILIKGIKEKNIKLYNFALNEDIFSFEYDDYTINRLKYDYDILKLTINLPNYMYYEIDTMVYYLANINKKKELELLMTKYDISNDIYKCNKKLYYSMYLDVLDINKLFE